MIICNKFKSFYVYCLIMNVIIKFILFITVNKFYLNYCTYVTHKVRWIISNGDKVNKSAER